MKQIDLAEGARRQHRAIALFAALQCWIRGLDGICLQRRHFLQLIGLERFKESRVQWIEKDFREFFEFQQLIRCPASKSLRSLFVSRVRLPKFPMEAASDKERIDSIEDGGPRLGILHLWEQPNEILWKRLENDFPAFIPMLTERGNCTDRLLSSYLGLIASGQISLRSLVLSLPEPEDE
jgi:hypothetical protein